MVDDAQNARPHKVEGRTVQTKRTVPREELGQPGVGATVKELSISGLKQGANEENLKNYFKTYGNIVRCEIAKDEISGENKDTAYIQFDDYDPVDKVCLQSSHKLGDKYINVKKALSNTETAGAGSSGRGGPTRAVGGGGGSSGSGEWGGPRGGGSRGGGDPWERRGGAGGGRGQGGGQCYCDGSGNWSSDNFGGGYQQNFGGGPVIGNYRSGGGPNPYSGGAGGGSGCGGHWCWCGYGGFSRFF